MTVTPVRDDWISGDAKTSSNSVVITLGKLVVILVGWLVVTNSNFQMQK